MTKPRIFITGSILLVAVGAFVAGRHTAPGNSAMGDSGGSPGSRHGASSSGRHAAFRNERSKGGDFPATKEGRLALLQAILGNGDAVARNQAFDRFLSQLDIRDYADVSKILASQKPLTEAEGLSIRSVQQTLFSLWARREPEEALKAVDTLPASGMSMVLRRSEAVETIASAWGAEDPETAIAWARKRPGFPWTTDEDDPFMIGLVGSVATQDVDRATRLLGEMPSGYSRRRALSGVISHLLAGGEDAAVRWIDGLQDENLKKGASILVAENMVDPARALEWIESRTGSYLEHSGVDAVFKKWMTSDSDGAKRHFDSLPPGPLRSLALDAIADSMAGTDLSKADDFRWLAERIGDATTAAATASVSDYGQIFYRWMGEDRSAAIKCFEGLPRETAIPLSGDVVNRLLRDSDGESASDFVRDNFDRLNDRAIILAVTSRDKATAATAMKEVETHRPDLVPKMRALVTLYEEK